MKNLLLESFLFWSIAGTCVLVFGYALSQATGKRWFTFAGLGAGALTVAVGAFLVYFVKTDEKLIRESISAIENSVRNNDPDGVLKYVSEKAFKTRMLVDQNLRSVEIESAKVSNFKILELNRTTSPPRAIVSLRGSAKGKVNVSGGGLLVMSVGPYPFNGIADFSTVELRREQDGVWRVTDNVTIDRVF